MDASAWTYLDLSLLYYNATLDSETHHLHYCSEELWICEGVVRVELRIVNLISCSRASSVCVLSEVSPVRYLPSPCLPHLVALTYLTVTILLHVQASLQAEILSHCRR